LLTKVKLYWTLGREYGENMEREVRYMERGEIMEIYGERGEGVGLLYNVGMGRPTQM
jgi:hypothetical protein